MTRSTLRYTLLSLLLTTALFSAPQISGIKLDPVYFYLAGDNPAAFKPEVDVSDWQQVSITRFPDKNWRNIGIFRYTLRVDSSKIDAPLSLRLHLIGAVEVYLDGDRIASIGTVGVNPQSERPVLSRTSPFLMDIRFEDNDKKIDGFSEHVLVFRYSAHILDDPVSFGFSPGFQFELGERSVLLQEREDLFRRVRIHQMLLLGIFVTVGLTSLLLFAFYPRIRPNLFFAIFSITWAMITYLRFEEYFYVEPTQFILNLRLTHLIGIIFILSAIRIVYILLFNKTPKAFWLAVGIGGLVIIIGWLQPSMGVTLLFLFLAVAMVEILRVIILARVKKIVIPYRSNWLILWGLIPYAIVVVLRMLPVLANFDPIWDFAEFPVVFYATLFPVFSMLIFVAVNFARTNKDLEAQLLEVQRLSKQTLEQELEKARLQAENDRKTQELEEARQLQFAMLPKKMPDLPDFEMAAFMETATEVGGDYYDFTVDEKGDLIVAFGDATGHGLQAGTVVTATKSLFQSMVKEAEPVNMLQKMSPSIKAMGLGNLYMALTIAKISGHKITISAAAMPFPLVFRAESRTIETIELRGVPLGSFTNFVYETQTIELKNNDVLLFMSDGLPEMFNEKDEQFEDERTIAAFLQCATKSPQSIISFLIQAGRNWAGDEPQHDDVTFLVIKKVGVEKV